MEQAAGLFDDGTLWGGWLLLRGAFDEILGVLGAIETDADLTPRLELPPIHGIVSQGPSEYHRTSMAFPVQQLIAQKQKPVVVSPVELADAACRLMREHGFSQLPVVSDKGAVLGLVTHESILRALGHLNVALERLHISAALIRPRTFFPDDDIFDLLDAMADEYATLIIDKNDRLLGIVTQDDLLVYFRRRAEDMLLVEEIEMGLRDHVLCAFSHKNGALAREDLCAAVDEIADQAGRFRKKFEKALNIYLGSTKAGSVDSGEVDRAFKAFDLKWVQLFSDDGKRKSWNDSQGRFAA
jgi:CBS domain-containing protein